MRNRTIFSYAGKELKFNLLDKIYQDLEDVLKQEKYTSTFKRILFTISSECIENMCNYGLFLKEYDENYFFTIETNGELVFIKTKNYIKTSDVESLEKKIQIVESLSKDELKPHFDDVISGDKTKKKGGAGLGFILMKRKSGNPIESSFSKVSKSVTEFNFKITLSINSMKIYRKEATKHSPLIQIDLFSEKIEISGHSRPENADLFYAEPIGWINENKDKLMELSCPKAIVDLEYFNSSSLKNLVRLLNAIIINTSDKLVVEWYYDADDEAAYEDGKEISKMTHKEFVFIEKHTNYTL